MTRMLYFDFREIAWLIARDHLAIGSSSVGIEHPQV